MKIKVIVGPKQGSVIHVSRSQQTHDMIAAGFWEEIQDDNQPKPQPSAVHTIPPAPPQQPVWKSHAGPISGVPTLEVLLPRSGGETCRFFGQVNTPAYEQWIRYVGGVRPPADVIAAYLRLQNCDDGDVIREARARERAELEAKCRATETAYGY